MRSGSVSFGRAGRRSMMVVVVCCGALLLAAHGRTLAQEDKASDAALELKLSVYESAVCPDASLTLSLEITNTGERQVRIHRQTIWSQFSSSKVGSPSGRSSISCGIDNGRPDNWIVIEPGDKYLATHPYSLGWDSFFKDAGRYKISTSLPFYIGEKYSRYARSNEAEFEVRDCAAK